MGISRSKLGSGATLLIVSGIICKVLGALFRLPLTNLLGIGGIGVFQMVMSLYSFALVVTCGGITNSLAKLISSARAKNEHSKISIYFVQSIFVGLGIGLLLGLLFLALSKIISAFQSISAWTSYTLFILLLPLGAMLASLRGFFQGHENMTPTAVSQVVEQVIKFVFGLTFAFVLGKFGTAQGVFGAFVGIVLSELVAVIYLFFQFYFSLKKEGLQTKKFSDEEHSLAKGQFFRANFPLMLSSSILPLVNAFEGLVIVSRLNLAGFSNEGATQLFGLQTGVVGAILNFPLIISIAVTTTLLPNISYLISRGTGGRYTIEKGLKVLLFLLLPTTFGIVAISKPVLEIFYTGINVNLLDTAFWLMFYGGFSILFTALMQYFVMLLQANGKFSFILTITIFGGLIKGVLSFFLSAIPNINIFALVIGNIAMSGTISVFALFKLKKISSFKFPFGEITLLIFATVVMFETANTFVNCNYYATFINVLIAIILGIVTYVVLTIPFSLKLLKAIKKIKPSQNV